MNVIFIDDDEDLNYLQEKICAQSSRVSNYFIATSAHQTLDYLSNTNIPPDIIFVDINMPVMNGFEFIEVYEKEYASRFPDTQLYVVSSSIRAQDRKKALDYESVQDFLEKPLTKEKLEDIFYQYAKT